MDNNKPRYIKLINGDAYILNATEPLEDHISLETGFYEIVEGAPDLSWDKIIFTIPE